MISAGGLVLFFVTTLGYAMDYILSRETNFYSSMIGFITDIDMGAAGMSLVTLSVCLWARRRPLRTVLAPQHLNDLGNILLALVILWMYTSFAQFLIIWCGNIREDNGYYIFRGFGRIPNGWRWIAATLVVGHFFIPFFVLLMKGLKRKTRTLGAICAWLLVMRIVESEWLVGPSGPNRPAETNAAHPIDILAWGRRRRHLDVQLPANPGHATDAAPERDGPTLGDRDPWHTRHPRTRPLARRPRRRTPWPRRARGWPTRRRSWPSR